MTISTNEKLNYEYENQKITYDKLYIRYQNIDKELKQVNKKLIIANKCSLNMNMIEKDEAVICQLKFESSSLNNLLKKKETEVINYIIISILYIILYIIL